MDSVVSMVLYFTLASWLCWTLFFGSIHFVLFLLFTDRGFGHRMQRRYFLIEMYVLFIWNLLYICGLYPNANLVVGRRRNKEVGRRQSE